MTSVFGFLRAAKVAGKRRLSVCPLTIMAIIATISIMKTTLNSVPSPSNVRAQVASVSASEAKNEFGHVLERVIQGGVMVITKHGAAKAVLMPVEEYNALSRATQFQLSSLTKEFDELLLRMQTPKARAAMKAAFHASPKQLGKAAVAAVRSRG